MYQTMVSQGSAQVNQLNYAMQTNSNPKLSTPRIALIDVFRGVALIAMTLYHLAWDLEFYGFAAPGTTLQTGWVLFARSIATSFLFLAGVSLFLGHKNDINWKSFGWRMAMIAAAALIITVSTYFTTPNAYIFFGILHAIALFSLLGLAFVFAPWWLTLTIAVAVFFLTEFMKTDLFANPIWWWLGLSPKLPVSSDFVPLFPWFSAALAGIAAAKLAHVLGWIDALRGVAQGSLADRTLGFLGRHSLVYYMLHQPIMLAGLWVFVFIVGPADRTQAFLSGCAKTCSQTSDAAFCEKFCSCTAGGLKKQKLFQPFFKGEVDLATNSQVRKIIDQCSIR